MTNEIVMPHFATEAEEADWWFDNREEHGEIMARAKLEGRTYTFQQMREMYPVKDATVPIQLDSADVQRARVQAQARGVEFEQYVRGLLHEALMKNDAA